MSKKIFNIHVDGDFDYEYEREDKDDVTTHSLYYSNDDGWHDEFKGQLIGKIIDDGNGYKVKGTMLPDKKGNMDYLDAIRLNMLLKLADMDNPILTEFTEVPQKVVF